MNYVVEILLWPVVMFLQAIVGVLAPAKTPPRSTYQYIARLALFASVWVLSLIPLSMLFSPIVGVKPLLALGVVLLLVFVVFGNLADENEDDDEEFGGRD